MYTREECDFLRTEALSKSSNPSSASFSFRAFMSLLINCLVDITREESGMLKSPTTDKFLSICLARYVSKNLRNLLVQSLVYILT